VQLLEVNFIGKDLASIELIFLPQGNTPLLSPDPSKGGKFTRSLFSSKVRMLLTTSNRYATGVITWN